MASRKRNLDLQIGRVVHQHVVRDHHPPRRRACNSSDELLVDLELLLMKERAFAQDDFETVGLFEFANQVAK